MKAIVFEKYGPPEVLHLEEIDKPKPKDDEILVKVMATSVSAGDWRMRKPSPMLARLYNGLFKPKKIKILGFELSGIIEEIGVSVKRFKVGDRVFSYLGFKFGGYAEYKCINENSFVSLMPNNLSFEEAAVVPTSSITALSFIRDKAKVKSGQNTLIYGASGSVGTYALQLAKFYGAKVTAVCSTANLAMVKSIGADKVIDYKTQNFTDTEEKYDLVFDAVNKTSKKVCAAILNKSGRYVSVHDSTPKIFPEHLEFIKSLIEDEKLKPVIDQVYNMNEIVEAHKYVERGHKKGNVAVIISHTV